MDSTKEYIGINIKINLPKALIAAIGKKLSYKNEYMRLFAKQDIKIIINSPTGILFFDLIIEIIIKIVVNKPTPNIASGK